MSMTVIQVSCILGRLVMSIPGELGEYELLFRVSVRHIAAQRPDSHCELMTYGELSEADAASVIGANKLFATARQMANS